MSVPALAGEGPVCPGEGDCCESNLTPGCDDGGCCNIVCDIDPICCQLPWDGQCAATATMLCEGLCSPGGHPACAPGSGDCFVQNGTPGCFDEECCNLICSQDDFCCEVNWDLSCVEAAMKQCRFNNPACRGEGDCFEANGTIGCEFEECCNDVCELDIFCCDTEWDGRCAGMALDVCVICPGADDCATPHETPGCDDEACCSLVCEQTVSCCQLEWDESCAALAQKLCSFCPADTNNDGTVDVQDMTAVILGWGTADKAADINGDGTVDVQDLTAVILGWGPCG